MEESDKMKITLVFIFLWGFSSAFYINRFQKWKGDDSDEKGAARHRYGYLVRRVHIQPPQRYITFARAGGSSEEEDSSDEQEESVDAGKNGKSAGSEEGGAEETEGKGAEEEEADSEGGEEENGGTSAPEVEESTASLNETGTEQPSTASESSTDMQPTQAAAIDSATTQREDTPAAVATELPKGSVIENVGPEEGSNGVVASTTTIYDPEYNEYQYENYYEHENEIDPRKVRGDTYVRYGEEYDPSAHQYQYYQ